MDRGKMVVAKSSAAKPQRNKAVPEAQKSEKPPRVRGVWSGQMRLALVSFPVELISAVKPGGRLAFHQVDSKSHKRVHYEKVAPGIGKVAPENIVKAFEISKGNYVLVTDDDLQKVKIEANKIIDLVQFVDHFEVDPIYFDKPYFVLAEGKLASEAYSVLRDAMRATNKMGLGQFVMRGREYIAAIRPCGQGLLLETLRFSDEIRAAAPFFADMTDAGSDPELLDLAKDLIKRKAKKFDPDRFHDHYTEALRQLIEAKSQHQIAVDDVVDDTQAEHGNVIELVEALRRSVKENTKTPASNPTAAETKMSGTTKKRGTA